ncbi:MAG: sigma-54-dependent Fis family transcriptional regulator [Ignavibacteriales bacterium]|nr:sigma-54-dependent Fis family transcriptional regulator [Ignavibacteriales bacterium]
MADHGIIGKSKQIKDLIDISQQVAKSDISVLIYGESGVGKDVFARTIHKFSNRSNNKLISVNCGAIPEGILESELFGHKKGSFTGAIDDRKGYFELADKSTLFLDEIAEMPLTTQVKLLRVLETGEFLPLGSETTKKVDVRIIAATNKDLQTEVDAKRFRKDLYFRLKAVTLYIPPLRERKEDIILLINHFLKNYVDLNNSILPKITNDAYELLTNYSWPGNIRELKNVIETAAALDTKGRLDQNSFNNLLSFTRLEEEIRNLPVTLHKTSESLDREIILGALIEIKKDLNELKNFAYKSSNVNTQNRETDLTELNEIVPINILEKNAIINAIKFTKGNKRKAANLLGLSERTLYRKLNEYGI